MSAHHGLGLALGMGGARGWCHIGVLRELDSLGVQIDRVAGCSMGAFVGVAWAADRLDALEEWALGLTRTKFLGYLDPRLKGGGLVAGREIAGLLDLLEIPETFDDLSHPFRALATDLETGREVWFDHGSLRDAVRASVSIPGVVNPYRCRDMWLLDGGLTDPVPVLGCRAMGPGPVLGVDPNAFGIGDFWTPAAPSQSFSDALGDHLRSGSEALGLGGWFRPLLAGAEEDTHEEPPSILEVLMASIDIMSAATMRMRLAAAPPDLLIQAPLAHIGVLEFDHAAEAIDAGRQLVRDNSDRILGLLE